MWTENIHACLQNPITGLCITLGLAALAVSGRFSVNLSNLLLIAAFFVGSFGIYHAGYGIHFTIISCLSLGIALTLTSWWLKPRKPSLPTPAHKLELKIIGMVVTGIYNHSTRLQLTVHAVNHGQPTTAHRWQLIVKTSTGNWEAKYMPGQQPIKGSLNVPPLDEALRHPLGTNIEIDGFLYFLLPQISQSTAVEQLKDDPKATLSLTVLDSINHEWITERNTSEMSKERLEHRSLT